MSREGSVTQWLRGLKDGDELAAARLWERYYHRMRGLADKQLGGVRRTVADEDDAVLGAFADFCEQAKSDGFKQGLDNRDELWQVLALVVKRKAIDQFRKVRQPDEKKLPADPHYRTKAKLRKAGKSGGLVQRP